MEYAPLTPAEDSLSERDLLDRLAASPAYGFLRSGPDQYPLDATALIGRPLSELEHNVLKLADRDGLSTLRQPGRVWSWLQWLLGVPRANPLADPRLEALRRYCVAKRFDRVDLVGQATLNNILSSFSCERAPRADLKHGRNRHAPSRRQGLNMPGCASLSSS
jgi:hypothetical protein